MPGAQQMHEGTRQPSSRVPSLDGLRAVAILLVIAGHVTDRTIHTGGWRTGLLDRAAPLGVDLFFTISGFIITSLLLRERRQTGEIHLWRFYARRAVRLWPALWVLVLVTGLLGAIGVYTIRATDILGALLFINDYLVGPQHAMVLYHTWSLAIEEQFYLIWPAAMIMLSAARARKVMVAALLAAPFVRVASYFLIPAWRGPAAYQFHDRYDMLAAGCLLALCWDDPRLQGLLRRHRRPLLAACCLAILAMEAVTAHSRSAAFLLTAGYSIEAVALAGIVATSIAGVSSSTGRVLNCPVMVHVGLVSYSLYLWQQMFTVAAVGPFTTVPLGLLAAVCCAELSWHLVERPFEGLRARLHPGPTARHDGKPAAVTTKPATEV